MLKLQDLSGEKFRELRANTVTINQKKELRKLLLDTLAEAYSSDEYIHQVYYERANRLLDDVTHDLLAISINRSMK